MQSPKRGEVWLVDLGMATKVRPCVVMSIPYEGEERALTSIIPHTTSSRKSRFEVRLNVSFLHQGVFDAQNILTIPSVKLIRKLGILSVDDMIS
ncbi:MAG: type II toxin-antitoxin system PemK/MazF family toxin [Ignavibacteriae bacterium]|nr:type II toxin-antitoxin system PemK/MazF family toxin [Ignavibacteriota bacterium]